MRRLGPVLAVLLLILPAAARRARAAECPQCTGTGILVSKCAECDGRGNYECKFCKGLELRGTDRSTGVIVCISCQGKGWFGGAAGGRVPCKRCSGKGRFKCPKCINGRINCKTCSAAGQLTRKCELCAGTGKVAADANKDALRAEKTRLTARLDELRAELQKLRKRLAEIDAALGVKPPPPEEGGEKKPPNDEDDF